MLMDDQLAGWTRLDINAKKYGKYHQTLLHRVVKDEWSRCEFFKFMLDNIERFKIDVNAKDDNGRTPFDMLIATGGGSVKAKKLEVWLIKYPESLSLDIFKKMSKNSLAYTLGHQYYSLVTNFKKNQTVHDKNFVNYANETLQLPRRLRKSGRIWNWLETQNDKEKLEDVALKYFRDRIEDPQPPAKKRRI